MVSDELNVSPRLACGLALVAYMKAAEVLGLPPQDYSGCLEPMHKVSPYGGYVSLKDNPKELSAAVRREQQNYLPGDFRTEREKAEEAEAAKKAMQASARAAKRKAKPQVPLASLIDEWREPTPQKSAASSRAASRAGSPSRPGPSWADVAGTGSRASGADAVASPGVPGISDWVESVDLDSREVDRFLDESEKMCTGTEDMDENFEDAHENM